MSSLVDEYRRLLIADESVTHLDEALALVRRIASGRGASGSPRWLNLLDARGDKGAKDSAMIRRAQAVIWALVDLSRDIERVIDSIPDAQYSLLMDGLLLVFHQAYYVLLPKSGQLRRGLLDAFSEFARAMPRHADRSRLEGLIALEKGDVEGASSAFRAAVYATHADDHEFLTRVQMFWMQLLSLDRDIEAFEFLLDISPRVSRKDLEEFNQLLLQAYRAAPGHARRGAAQTSA